jgi:hypothetical protein
MWAWLCFIAGIVLLAFSYTWGLALLLTPIAAWCIDEYRRVTDLIAAIRAGQRAAREDLAALVRDNSAMDASNALMTGFCGSKDALGPATT